MYPTSKNTYINPFKYTSQPVEYIALFLVARTMALVWVGYKGKGEGGIALSGKYHAGIICQNVGQKNDRYAILAHGSFLFFSFLRKEPCARIAYKSHVIIFLAWTGKREKVKLPHMSLSAETGNRGESQC